MADQTKALAPQQERYNTLRAFLMENSKEIAALAGDSVDPKMLMRVSLSIVKADDKLLSCTPRSILAALLQCARLMLEPTGRVGGAYLVPFAGQAQLITDYRGEITLCVRSGFCVAIKPVIVYEKDDFRPLEGTEQKLIHRPDYKSEDRGAEQLVYAVATLPGGEHDFEVLSRAEIERRRKMSKLGNSGAWKDHYWRMALKSAVRAIANRMAKSSTPKDRQLARAYQMHIQREEAVEFGDGVVIDVEADDPAVPPKSSTENLADRIANKVVVEDEQARWEAEQKRKADDNT